VKVRALLDAMDPLCPVDCIGIHGILQKGVMTKLADLSALYEMPCSTSSLQWDAIAIRGCITMPKSMQGDALEIVIDTRHQHTGGIPTRFCHRFLIQYQEEVYAKETTQFPMGDDRALIDSKDLEVIKTTEDDVDIVQWAFMHLYGYDPEIYTNIGFGYQIYHKSTSLFSFPCGEFSAWKHPQLMATYTLIS